MYEQLYTLRDCFEESNIPLIYQKMTKRSGINTVKVKLVKLSSDNSLHLIERFYKPISRTILKISN
jgi:hypothetical protein